MRMKVAAVAAVSALSLALTGCGKGEDEGAAEPSVEAEVSFEAGTTMAKLNEQGTIKIGVKFDQPGLAYKDPASGSDVPVGFDASMGELVAAKLGIEADKIEWVETVTKNREPFAKDGTVDIVVASFTINDERRANIGMAGPYYETGQQLLVKKDNETIKGPEDVKGKTVCSATGSTSIKRIEEDFGAVPAPAATYSECIQAMLNGSVEAVTTDGSILMGYAAQDPDKLKVVGDVFSSEPYGIGFKHGDVEFCKFLNKVIEDAVEDGTWEKMFDDTLGKSGAEAPDAPKPDPCE